MISDSITKASIPMAAANPKDLAKKKKAHRSAKLKQYKLDARREQWLSQVKNKGTKEELDCLGGRCGSVKDENDRAPCMNKLEINPRKVEEDNEGSIHNYSDLDSPANSPTNYSSSDLGGNYSSTNFTGSSGSSNSSQCWSGNMSEEEEEEGNDGCLDDWEAIADALAVTDEKHTDGHSSSLGLNDNGNPSGSQSELSGKDDNTKAKCRAWRHDDAFRPQSLPSLSKQYSFPMNTERRGSAWGNMSSAPKSCPICCEDLDFTDTSFLPCLCGFRLCLFCHKRILEEDGRCPGCRKQYDEVGGSTSSFRLSRSFTMISRP
ncbi:hypothetical protein DM860_017741 [Cuscuta australis]|uniref:RING-type domain-containing protein n=1 Tax=Cuscuta australis TaxID=267555 RepID=A0A328D5P7_9ASTE|nr:hypothetical protein DM860_017741 [Cuscuta australis]